MRLLVLSITLAATALATSGCRESASSSASSTATPPSVEVKTPGIEIARVSWPAADRVDRTALSRLPPAAAARVAQARVPVMVPQDARLLANATIMTEEVFYAFAASLDGMNVSIQGTRGEYRSGEVMPFERADVLRGKPALVTETDAIWTATWTENGVAYVVSVECARADDARCKGKQYVRELAEQLAYVGGAAEGSR